MCFDLFTNKLQTITSILLVQNKLLNRYLQIIYIKSHKFITHERPHEQSSRIKPLRLFLCSLSQVQLNGQLDVPYLL